MLLAMPRSRQIAFRETLHGVSTKRIRVALLDRRGDVLRVLTPAFQDGDLTVTTDADVTRSCNLTLLDPKHAFGFDADTYQGGDLDLTRMIRVWWRTDGPLLDRPVSTPVMTGPITRLLRDGPIVSVEVQGKEVYGLRRAKRTWVMQTGTKTDAIKGILRDLMGETLMSIPDLPDKLSRPVVIHPKDQPFKEVMRLAESLNRQFYFPGTGIPTLRPYPSKPVWKFSAGVNGRGNLTSPLSVEADLTRVVNQVRVTGRTPKGEKEPVTALVTADESHSLSPQNLGVPGAPAFLLKEIQNDQLRTKAQCQEVGERMLERGLRLGRQVMFNAAPVPGLDPHDVIRVETDFESVVHSLDTFTLPLGLGRQMQVGYTGPYRTFKRGKGGHR